MRPCARTRSSWSPPAPTRPWPASSSCASPSAPPVRRGPSWIWARSAGWSTGLLEGGKVQLEWNVPQAYWAKDWAKLLMNATLLAADCLPRGGVVRVEAGADPAMPVLSDPCPGPERPGHRRGRTLHPGRGQPKCWMPGHVQPFLTHRLSRTVNAGLAIARQRRHRRDLTPAGRLMSRSVYLTCLSSWPHSALIFRLDIFVKASAERPRPGGKYSPMAHCLIVDDSRVIRTVARRIFEELAFRHRRSRGRHGGLARLPRENARPDFAGLVPCPA